MGQDGALVIDPVQVASGHVGHADSMHKAVQKLVPVLVDGMVELR